MIMKIIIIMIVIVIVNYNSNNNKHGCSLSAEMETKDCRSLNNRAIAGHLAIELLQVT